MLRRLLSRNADLQRLADEGYQLEIRNNYLLVLNVPYVTTDGTIAYGDIVTDFAFADDVLAPPGTHTVWFTGLNPCDRHGQRLNIANSDGEQSLAEGLVVQHQFSRQPQPKGLYDDYHHKLSTYAWILASPARQVDPSVTPQNHAAIVDIEDDDGIFRYIDNASTRVGIAIATNKLRTPKVAIVGLGGTGSYILDFLAKVPIKELHLFDGDELEQHNAFRAPGAVSSDDINARQKKVDYYAAKYDAMRTGVVPHPYFMTEDRLNELSDMDFVFIAGANGSKKRTLVDYLVAHGIDFIDVGMGLLESDGAITAGQIRTSAVTERNRDEAHSRQHIPIQEDVDDDYDRNIQIAELNALNAALAVIQFKKRKGFYVDLEHETRSIYTVTDNYIVNVGGS